MAKLERVKRAISSAPIIDLHPRFVIDDDFEEIGKYLFAASKLVQTLKASLGDEEDEEKDEMLTLQIQVIPRSVSSIYEPQTIDKEHVQFDLNVLNQPQQNVH
eukprot:CAMPEP_0197034246 /NCGR_PEP_ID=MMETSP1384-20130603/12412_1 /TAXON_ID=29189 /ORGANISM="Ammonia sp." /LENGTH=102 /DNA_ID=CAMNT_0042464149 /DNA_START=21 /DNA_END=326 /DNA_ORIENTATION=+